MTKDELEESLKYQDFIADQLLNELGWCINLYTSRFYQYNYGESRAGVEIKFDKKMASTGNLYIELEERHSTDKDFVPSGINRQDNTLHWCIGDYNEAYIFVKAQLKSLCTRCNEYNFRYIKTDTSRGILIPLSFFDKHGLYVVKKLNFKEQNK